MPKTESTAPKAQRRPRRCVVLRGSPEETARTAAEMVQALPASRTLWIGSACSPYGAVPASKVRQQLGQGFDAVVLDLHDGLDADVLGQCSGMVWGGGRLLLRMPPKGVVPRGQLDGLAVFPFAASDVGDRFWNRFERMLADTDARAQAEPMQELDRGTAGDSEQAQAVKRLADAFVDETPSLWALTADRGRGKSSALGMALGTALHHRALRAAVCASQPEGAQEIFRFAIGSPHPPTSGPIEYVTPQKLAKADPVFDVIVIDEAAQLPVPLLMAITRQHARARIAFASTGRGYEGTGRGFVLRFLLWAQQEGRPFVQLQLQRPIRFEPDDPLERFVDQVLALDAEPAQLPVSICEEGARWTLQHVILDRNQLAQQEALLREFFGLLVHAHYRTTPADLHKMLDAPNLALHALLADGQVVAASVIAKEGGFPKTLCEKLARGQGRIRGHALADTLITHAGQTESGVLSMIRSVRVAVHPALRRRHLAAALVSHVHQSYPGAELFGTLFGATPELLRFRRSVGYELVRVGASRGSRTGEPAAVMLKAVSARAHGLLHKLREELARNLPLQLALLTADDEAYLDPALVLAMQEGLPSADPIDEDARRKVVQRYLESPQPMDAVIAALRESILAAQDVLSALPARERRLIELRVLRGHGFEQVAKEAGFPSIPAAMRALRPALRMFWDQAIQRRA